MTTLLACSGSLGYSLLPSGMELARIYVSLQEERSVMSFFPAQPVCCVWDKSGHKSARVGSLRKTQTPKNLAAFLVTIRIHDSTC